ncbi:MAG: MarR family winged helix-turn-helix transcriptional regulator [Gammaproteobacteria bacterium]|nr:MarR family winged helix-turn-helix transcriptional regulator [Gammaproteobacteria bacterium]
MNNILQLIQRLAVVAQAENRQLAGIAGLQPVHLDVLRYLARCNRYSNTPAAVGQFLGSTKGTVSQSVKVLEREMLISKLSDANDGRVIRLRLLKKGRDLIKRVDEESVIHAATEDVGAGERKVLENSLAALLRRAQRRNGSKSFGVCSTCRFFTPLADGGFLCGMTNEPLSVDDSLRICVEHENEILER